MLRSTHEVLSDMLDHSRDGHVPSDRQHFPTFLGGRGGHGMQAEIILRVFWESSSKGDHLAETRIPLYFFLFHLSSIWKSDVMAGAPTGS